MSWNIQTVLEIGINMFCVSKDDEIWLILWWSKSKCFDFFQILEHMRAVGIFINLHTESVDSSIDLCVEEAVSQRDLVPEAVLSLYLLKHVLDGVHTPMNPVFSELQSVCLELCLNLFQQAQILIGMNSSIYHLTEGSYLCLFYWSLGKSGRWGYISSRYSLMAMVSTMI